MSDELQLGTGGSGGTVRRIIGGSGVSVSPPSGRGDVTLTGASVLRGIYTLSATDVGANSRATWAEQGGVHQDHPLDLTVPTAPVALVAGNIEVSASMAVTTDPVNTWLLVLDIDDDGDDLTQRQSIPGAVGSGGSVASSYFVPAGGKIVIRITQTSGGNLTFGGSAGVIFRPE